MDFISVFVASILFCFFASNFSLKYEDERVSKYLNVWVFISFISECLIICGYLSFNYILLFIGATVFASILCFQLYDSFNKIRSFNKDKKGKSNYECAVISLRNVFMVVGALICVVQKIIELIFEIVLYNE